MADDRLAKQTVRRMWLKSINELRLIYNDNFPLYLTLPGAEGRDISLLADNNIIKLTEVGAIAPESAHLVVAIERDKLVASELRKRYPGLSIAEVNFSEVVQGNSLLRYPGGGDKYEKFCCASVINLDFQSTLGGFRRDGVDITFLNWIKKLSLLRESLRPSDDWCLFLTLNAVLIDNKNIDERKWQFPVNDVVNPFLYDNFIFNSEFAQKCTDVFGDEICTAIRTAQPLPMSLTVEEQQKLLMVYIPKKIASSIRGQRWSLETTYNVRYGGNDNHAPMVSWIFRFRSYRDANLHENRVYNESLMSIFPSMVRIKDDGEIVSET